MSIRTIRHGRIDLALHQLRDGPGPTLLLLHGLGERSATEVPGYAKPWVGPVAALDFTGHGASDVPRGGGYTAEVLGGDVDAVLNEIGDVVIVGRGLGGYIGLIAAAARPQVVQHVIISDGPGLAGGPDEPASASILTGMRSDRTPDPYALVELSRDLRPADYAVEFTRIISSANDRVEPVKVTARFRPPWLQAVVRERGVITLGSLHDAITLSA